MTTDEIRALLAAATPGPWIAGVDRVITAPDIDCPNDPWSVAKATGLCGWPIIQTDANARLIAAAPTIAALAITQAEQLAAAQAEIERMWKLLSACKPRIADMARTWQAEADLLVRIDAALKEPKP